MYKSAVFFAKSSREFTSAIFWSSEAIVVSSSVVVGDFQRRESDIIHASIIIAISFDISKLFSGISKHRGGWVFESVALVFQAIRFKKRNSSASPTRREENISEQLKETRILVLPPLGHSWLPQDIWYRINTISRVWTCVLLGPDTSTGTGF